MDARHQLEAINQASTFFTPNGAVVVLSHTHAVFTVVTVFALAHPSRQKAIEENGCCTSTSATGQEEQEREFVGERGMDMQRTNCNGGHVKATHQLSVLPLLLTQSQNKQKRERDKSTTARTSQSQKWCVVCCAWGFSSSFSLHFPFWACANRCCVKDLPICQANTTRLFLRGCCCCWLLLLLVVVVVVVCRVEPRAGRVENLCLLVQQLGCAFVASVDWQEQQKEPKSWHRTTTWTGCGIAGSHAQRKPALLVFATFASQPRLVLVCFCGTRQANLHAGAT